MSVTYTGDINYDANGVPIQIGDTGVGSLVVNGGSIELFDSVANGNGSFIQIGAQTGSNGSILVTGLGSALALIGDGGFDTGMHVGAAGTGTLTVSSGALLDLSTAPANNPDEAGFTVGRSAGGTGTFTLDDATATLRDTMITYLQVGRDGANGTVNILNGAELTMNAVEVASMQIGNNGTGTFNMSGGSTVTIQSGNGSPSSPGIFPGSFFNLGRNSGTGTATLDGTTMNLVSEFEAGAGIGRSGTGGMGTMNLINGALLNIEAESIDTFLNVARDGADGILNVADSAVTMTSIGAGTSSIINLARGASEGTVMFDNSSLTMSSATSFTMFRIGRDAGADGTAIFKNGSTASIMGDMADITVGHTAGVTADLQVLSGSQITLDNTSATLGDSGFYVGRFASSTATATIDGTGSNISGMDITVVGGNTAFAEPAGNGTLTLTDGASLGTGDMLVGGGGTLIAGDATITLDSANAAFGTILAFDQGTTRLLADGPLYVNGNINAGSSSFVFEVTDGVTSGSIIQSGDSFTNDMENNILVQPLGGYTFSAGDGYTLFETNATTFEDILFDRSAPLVAVNDGSLQVAGQSSGFAYMFVETQDMTSGLDFVALNSGDGTGPRRLDFSASNPEDVSFIYNSGIGAGSGLVGTTDSVIAFNVDQIFGGAGNDSITAGGGDDFLIFGRDGNDRINVGGGDDKIYGQNGNDTLIAGGGNDVLVGGTGADSMNGGAGIDRTQYTDATSGLKADLQASVVNTGIAAGDTYTAIENLYGSNFGDDLRGDAGNNIVSGENGSDFMYGRDGDDTLLGGFGDDRMFGGAGADVLNGGSGNDRVVYTDSTGGIKADLLNSAVNTGIAAGDTYINIESLYGSNFDDDLRGDNANSTLLGRSGDDTIYGRDGDDKMFAGADNDVMFGGAGADLHNGGGGRDRAAYTDSAVGLKADLQNSAVNTGIAAGDTYVSVEDIYGSNHNDDIRGDAGNNVVSGQNGNDTLYARNGDDVLFGGNGNDTLYGGVGADGLRGGGGTDTAGYNDSGVGLRADLQNAAVNNGIAAGDTYLSVENLLGSNFNDDLRGDGGANRIDGRDGDDTLTGRDGDDELRGGEGNDLLRGGNGTDFLAGSVGADRFRFESVTEGADDIFDFGINVDTIQLDNASFTSLSNGALAAGNFHLGVAAADANDYVIYDNGALYYDADGNGAGAQVLIANLLNNAAIDQNDFFIL